MEDEQETDDGYSYLVSLHLKGGAVETAPYRTLAEAKYVASVFERLANGDSLEPPGVPFVYVFPPEEPIERVELHRKRPVR